MKVLVACEFSGIVRDAFTKMGHDAWSCDLLPSETEGKHYQGDVLDILGDGWDLMIAHPPCTHLSKAGAWCWKFKEKEQAEALEFIQILMDATVYKIAIENPVGKISTAIKKPNQIIHPYMFGDPWMKQTCLWLKGLPNLIPTTQVKPVGNWVKPGNVRPHRRFDSVPEGAGNSRLERSRTFQGIANAMAEQWG